MNRHIILIYNNNFLYVGPPAGLAPASLRLSVTDLPENLTGNQTAFLGKNDLLAPRR